VFARLVEGMPVAQKISTVAATDGIPNARVEIRKVTIREKAPPAPDPFTTETIDELAKTRAVIETSLGNITLEFFPDRAPEHVRNFLRLASVGVYDRSAFHRVVPGFVIQGGYIPSRAEPLDINQEKYVTMLEPEFSPTPHEKGILSMARGAEPASATTSFFLVLGPAPSLDNQYTVFGRVVEGLEVLDAIAAVPVEGETPVTRVEVTGVRVVRP